MYEPMERKRKLRTLRKLSEAPGGYTHREDSSASKLLVRVLSTHFHFDVEVFDIGEALLFKPKRKAISNVEVSSHLLEYRDGQVNEIMHLGSTSSRRVFVRSFDKLDPTTWLD